MIVDITGGMSSTHSWTWVYAFVVDTGQVSGTLRVDGTLMSTLNIGVSLESWIADT